MVTSQPSARVLTELDHIRVSNLLKPAAASLHVALEAVLDNAELISSYAVPPHLVTMNSQVLIADGQGGEERQITLCYPPDANPATGFVSVLSPVGTALLGLSEGESTEWKAPNGVVSAVKVVKVLFQPEESGEFLL